MPGTTTRPRLLLAMMLSLTACDDGFSDSGSSGVNLVVSGFWSEAGSGGGHVLHALIDNDGPETAAAFDVGFWLDRSDEPLAGQSPDLRDGVSGLAAGETAEVSVSTSTSCIGCQAWVLADVDDAVDEQWEDDNSSGPSAILE